MRKLPKGKNAKALARERYRMFLPYKNVILSITSDNGTEFYEHRRMAKMLHTDFYFPILLRPGNGDSMNIRTVLSGRISLKKYHLVMGQYRM
jgi:hypothetical protein